MRDLWRYRDWIWRSAISDLRHRYAGSGLGVFWNVLTPLAMLIIYTFVFTNVLVPRFAQSTMPAYLFSLYLSAGFLPWATFTDGLARGSTALLTHSVHLKKLPIPEQVFVAQVAVSSTLSMLMIVVLLFGLALVLGQRPVWTWLLMPVVALLWQAFGFGLSFVLATLNSFFRD